MIRAEDPGYGGFCTVPAPVRLGPPRMHDASTARAGAAANLLWWAVQHRRLAVRSETMSAYFAHRRVMRRLALMWRRVK